MRLNYEKAYSDTEPDLVDTTSSKSTVYIRHNVVKHTTKTDSGNTITSYEYEEAKLTKAEYQEYLKELEIIDIQKQRADIDYIALMSGIDLEV